MRPIAAWLVVVLATLLAPAASRAASVYSMVLIGEAVESGDVRAISLGGSTQLFVDSLGAVQSNAALLARVPRVTIAATQYLAADQGRSEDYSRRDVSFTFSSFRAVFPVASLVCLSVGYAGRYEPDAAFALRGVTDGGNQYTKTFNKTGGLFSVPFTASFDVTRLASVGLTVSLERGTVQERWDVVFDEREFTPGAGLRRHDVSGTGYGAAVALYPVEGLVIGGTWESGIDYDAEVYEKYTQSALDTSYGGTMTLPPRMSAGLTYRWADRFMVLASAARSDFAEFEGLGFPADRLGREEKYCVGFEYLEGVRLRGRRVPLRLGFNYGRLPFEFPEGQKVTRYLVSLGTGMKIRGGKGRLDVAVVAGTSGSLGENGIEDRLFRVYLGVSGSEAWKRRGAERY
jgi:hypothetical protein